MKEILNELKIEFITEEGKRRPSNNEVAKLIENALEEYSTFNKKGSRGKPEEGKKRTISERHINRLLKDYHEEKKATIESEKNTLDLLVNLLKYDSFDLYKEEHMEMVMSKECLFDPTDIIVSKLSVGSIQILGWASNYYMKVEYLGNYKFRVMNLRGDFKLEPGDEFEAKSFRLEYLYSLGEKNIGYPFHPIIRFSKEEENAKNLFSNL